MHIEAFRNYCLSKAASSEDLPFDEHTLVFKVMGKIFAITSLNSEVFAVNLKCDPDRALELREQYEEVQPGYHMNKKHWNTVRLDSGAFTVEQVQDMIDHSYDMVVKCMPRKDREALHKTESR